MEKNYHSKICKKVIAGALTELVLHMIMDCGDILEVYFLSFKHILICKFWMDRN